MNTDASLHIVLFGENWHHRRLLWRASLLVLGLVRWSSVNVTTRQPLGCEGLPRWACMAVGGHCHASLSYLWRRAVRSHLRWAQISLLRW